jgi:hypothetical protein
MQVCTRLVKARNMFLCEEKKKTERGCAGKKRTARGCCVGKKNGAREQPPGILAGVPTTPAQVTIDVTKENFEEATSLFA